MNWHLVTIRQFQQYEQLVLQYQEKRIDDVDFSFKLCSVMYGMAESDLDHMPNDEFMKLHRGLDFLNHPIPDEPVRHFTTNGNRYRLLYDIRKVRAKKDLAAFARAGTVAEVKAFSADGMTGNLHKVAASLIVPQRRRFGFWIDQKYDTTKHEQYANDMLDAPLIALHSYCVFFYQVLTKSISSMKPFLLKELTRMKVDETQAETLLSNLCNTMDGFSTHPWSLSLSESR